MTSKFRPASWEVAEGAPVVVRGNWEERELSQPVTYRAACAWLDAVRGVSAQVPTGWLSFNPAVEFVWIGATESRMLAIFVVEPGMADPGEPEFAVRAGSCRRGPRGRVSALQVETRFFGPDRGLTEIVESARAQVRRGLCPAPREGPLPGWIRLDFRVEDADLALAWSLPALPLSLPVIESLGEDLASLDLNADRPGGSSVEVVRLYLRDGPVLGLEVG